MRADVMQGFVPSNTVLTRRGHFVVGQRIHPGDVTFLHVGESCFLRTTGVDDGMTQQRPRTVNGGPHIRSTLDENGRVARLFEFFIVFDAVVVTVDTVMREDNVFDTAKEGVPFTEFCDIVVKRQAVGGVVVQEGEEAVRAGLNPPDGRKVRHAFIKDSVDGAVRIRFIFRGEAAQFPEAVDLAAVDGPAGYGVEGFIRDGGIFLSHFITLCAAFGFVPSFLFFIECDSVVGFQTMKVFGEFRRAGEFATLDTVFGLLHPAKEPEFRVKRCEWFAYQVHCFRDEAVVEAVLAAFMGGFQDDDSGLVNGVEGTRDGFLRLGGVMYGDGSEFRDMNELVGATAQGCSGVDGGAVGEFGFRGPDIAAFHFFLEPCADEGKFPVFFRRGLRKMVKVVEGEFYFGEFLFGFRPGAVYDARCVVGREHAHVQDEQGGVCGDAKLTGFEDVVVVVEAAVDLPLRPVEREADDFAVFVDDMVEVVQPPFAVG